MIKARAGKLLILGLSNLNLQRLQEGKPIAFDGQEVLLPGVTFVLIHGKVPQDIVEKLREQGFEMPDVPPENNF